MSSPTTPPRTLTHSTNVTGLLDTPFTEPTCTGSDFLDVLFPVTLAERLEVLRRLQDKGLWEAESSARVDVGKWANLPKSTSSERDLYQPFVDIANFVSECAGPVVTDGDERILDWLNCHAYAPESLFENDSKEIPDTIVRLTRCESFGGNGYRRVESFETLTWRQPVILGEFKAFKKNRSAILQLLRYARATYKHQPDRRFLYGFTFILKYLQVWYFDRAGGLGSRLIDVHKEPLLFIQFLLGISRKSATQLGFDTSFKMRLGDQLVNSYAVGRLCDPKQGDILWEFETLGEGNKGKETFVAFRFLTEDRPEVVRGRGTRIMLLWLASELDDGIPEAKRKLCLSLKVYVGKDMWRDARRVAEGQLYFDQGDLKGVAKLYSFEDLMVDGSLDSTGSTWDQLSLSDAKLTELYPDTKTTSNKSKEKYFRTFFRRDALPDYPTMAPWLDPMKAREVDVSSIYSRQHCRLILKTFGFPITDFISLEELGQVLADAIRGHKNLFDKGFLHRDISLGNIIIAKDPNSGEWCGIIIDQDYTVPVKHIPLLGDHQIKCWTNHPYTSFLSDLEIYKSAEDAANAPPRSPEIKQTLIPHRPIHDMESFFWLLCWICMSRRGPSTSREGISLGVDKNEAERDELAKQAVKWLFDCPMETCANRKRKVLTIDTDFNRCVIQHLAPYFLPLRPTLDGLRWALLLAYEMKEYDGIHDEFIVVLAMIPELLGRNPLEPVPHQEDMEKRAEHRRSRYNNPRSLYLAPKPDHPIYVDVDSTSESDVQQSPVHKKAKMSLLTVDSEGKKHK
ncbi:hypothetical protein NLI96_g892 [Meripilus lineatus]|uniref:Fungal-type protein kinase domain-containing protein n=1 Tax=Meripilus lineatus TaxID=2056292 RepID=A0AAD5VH24_9APHY|nr:hypothetical protein NLI96_g892 [Physisporinus lineatus]